MGFTMLLYPTSILFRAARAIERAAQDLLHGKALLLKDAVNMKQFEEIVDLQHWSAIEKRF